MESQRKSIRDAGDFQPVDQASGGKTTGSGDGDGKTTAIESLERGTSGTWTPKK